MKKLLIASLIASFTFQACAFTKGKPYKLTILHTNDHHGRFWQNKDGEYGLAARATIINQIREEVAAEGGYTMLLDAGDVNTGVPQSDLLLAEPDFKGMNLLKYDAMALGNHEFDKPNDVLRKQQKWANFPMLSANIYNKTGKKGKKTRAFPSHMTKNFDGLKVTVFGLTTEDTPLKTNAQNTKNFNFVPVVEEAKTLVPKLRKKTDVLIALTHIGHYDNGNHGIEAPGDVTLARSVNGIDVIIGGHTAKPLFRPDIQNGTVIAQAQDWGKYVGRLDFEYLDGKLTLKSAKLVPVNLKNSEIKVQANSEVEEFLRPYKEKGDSQIMIKLGEAETEFIGLPTIIRNGETNLGNLVTKAYKEKFNTDIAISNSGGIRDSMPAGVVTYETVLKILPFGNEISTTTMTGAELKEYFEKLVFDFKGSGGFPQISGVEIVGNKTLRKITSFKINGEDYVPTKKYTMTIPDFIASGQDKYPVISYSKTGFVDADILKDFVLKRKVLSASEFEVTNYLQIAE